MSIPESVLANTLDCSSSSSSSSNHGVIAVV